MKVLHVHRLRGVGGSERHLLALIPALRDRGIDARFLGLDDGDPDPFYGQLGEFGVPYERVRAPRDIDPQLAYHVVRAMRRMRPDLVHTHLVHADTYGALGATASSAAVVSTKHNDDPFRAGPFRAVERVLTRRASRVICITESLARFNRDVVGLPAAKLRVVRYGMDAPPPAWGTDPAVPVPAGARVLVAVSRLVPQKGLDVAVRALPAIRAAEPRAVLVVLGEGPEREALTGLAGSLGVADALRLPGHLGDVSHWLGQAELFVHPARWEGFGLVLLEAMLAGRAVVASNVSSIPEIVHDGVTGLLVPPDDPAALAGAVSELLADPARAAALGAAGRSRAHSSFSVGRMAHETVTVYEETLG
jgi:glycosyltransferase involved in cell wall biosynthesis